MNVLQKAAMRQAQFSEQMADFGYTTVTSFYGDLTIAEMDGEKGVRETYARVNGEWRNNTEYYTEFVIALNHKIYEHYETNRPLAEVYDELWREADAWVRDNWTGDALETYYNVTD